MPIETDDQISEAIESSIDAIDTSAWYLGIERSERALEILNDSESDLVDRRAALNVRAEELENII